MKQLILNLKKTFFLITIMGLWMSFANAQTKGNKRVNDSFGNWSIGAGINVVDDSGTEGKDFFNTKENWNVSNPYLVSVEYYFDNQWSIVASGSINKYVSGKNIDSTGVIVKGLQQIILQLTWQPGSLLAICFQLITLTFMCF